MTSDGHRTLHRTGFVWFLPALVIAGTSCGSSSTATPTASVTVTRTGSSGPAPTSSHRHADPSSRTRTAPSSMKTPTTAPSSRMTSSSTAAAAVPKSTSPSPTPSTTSSTTPPEPARSSVSTEPTVSSSQQADQFDESWARKSTGWIVESIKTIDKSLKEGGLVGLAYSNLSSSFGYLEEANVPPGANSASYLARLQTLKKFSHDAYTVQFDDPSEAAAKYLVLRKETQPLLNTLNPVLGTQYKLGPAPDGS